MAAICVFQLLCFTKIPINLRCVVQPAPPPPPDMNEISTRTLLFLLFFSSLVVATNYTQCLEDFNKNSSAIGGVDAWGHPTSPAAAVGLTYKTCTERCGSSPVPFSWRDFSQLFSAWILPWLALITQLPFGSKNYLDDFVSSESSFRCITGPVAYQTAIHTSSVVMSVGSPALAAYSLVLTALNNRSVYRRVDRIERIEDKNKAIIARALISLQQIPLELTKKEHFLAFISIVDQWEQEIVGRVDQRDAWSIATASSVAWVVVAFLFTLIDSFISLNNPANTLYNSMIAKSSPHSVGTLWLWLLCLVIGWLWVPTFARRELESALRYANHKAAKEAAGRSEQARQITLQTINSAKEIPRGSGESIIEAVEEDQKVEKESVQEVDRHAGQKTDQKSDPLPNTTARSLQLDSEGQRNRCHPGDSEDQNSAGGAQDRIDPVRDKLLIPKHFSYRSRDEFRHPATFNYARIFRFLVFVEDVSRMFEELSREKDEVSVSRKRQVTQVVSVILSRKRGCP